MLHLTCDMWYGVNILPKFQISNFTVWVYSEDFEEKGELMNESIINGGDCRTAPAKLGLLIIYLTFN